MEESSTGDRYCGSCLCGRVRHEVTGRPNVFQYCHCSRCRKVTGSAHAANLIVAPGQLRWLEGGNVVKRFEPAGTKYFATSFCGVCGCSLPWEVKGGRSVVVPAGTLDSVGAARPQRNIYWGSRPEWSVDPGELPGRETRPTRSG